MDIEETWRHFKENLNHCINQHVPAIKTNRKRRPPWLSQEILRDIRAKRRAWTNWKESKTNERKETYEKLQKSVTKKI
jgi:hypothetical protein